MAPTMVLLGAGAVVLILVAAAVAAAGAASRSGRAVGPADDRPLPGADRPRDPALEELRRLYARGEIDREEFLQRKIDLED